MQKCLTTLALFGALLGLGGFALLAYLFWGLDYEAFAQLLLAWADKSDWLDRFKQDYFPESRWLFLGYSLPFLALGYLALLVYAYKKRAIWRPASVQQLSLWGQLIRQEFRQTKPIEWAFFLPILCFWSISTLYQIQQLPIEYDEAWSFLHFSSRAPLFSLISPNNNHILYTFCSSLLHQLGVAGPWDLRLPSFWAVFGLLFFSYWYYRRLLGWRWGLAILALLALAPPIYIYGILGRGYGILLFFLGTYLWADGQDKRQLWPLLLLLAWGGIYSNPIFVLPYLGLVLSRFGQANWWRQQLLFALGSLLLYSPFILANGAQVLAGAAADSGQSLGSTYFYLYRLIDWQFWGRGLPLFWPYLLLILGLLPLVNKRGYWLAFSLLWPILLPFLDQQWPYRIFCYLYLFFLPYLGLALAKMPFKKAFILPLGLVLGLQFWASRGHYFLHWSRPLDAEAQKIAQLLLADPQAKVCYSFARYDKPLLQYYFLRAKRKLACPMPFAGSQEQAHFGPHFPYVLLDTEDYKVSSPIADSLAKHYHVIYRNERLILYKLN